MPKRKIATPRDTFDEPWKRIVTALFKPFLEFFAPNLAAQIDWTQPPDFQDKELQRIAKGFGGRKRATADFLVKVRLLNGESQWLIVHIELQAQKEAEFPLRMFLYNIRAFDLHKVPVVSLAVLADTDPNWRPNVFGYGEGTSRVQFEYRVVKLLDYREREAELEESENPFGLAVLAHLKTQETRGDAESRLQTKTRLTRMLFQRNWSYAEIDELLQFFDWILTLPEALEDTFEAWYKEIEKEQTMAETMSPLLQRAHDRGKTEGRDEGIEIGGEQGALQEARSLLLRLGRRRHGEPGGAVLGRVAAITDREELERLCERVYEADAWDELLAGG